MLHLRNFSAALLCYLSIIISRCVSAPIDRRALDRNTPGRLPAQDSAWTREDVRDLKRSLQSDINEQWDQCMNEWVENLHIDLGSLRSHPSVKVFKVLCARQVYRVHEKDPDYVWTSSWEKRQEEEAKRRQEEAQRQANQDDAGPGDVQDNGGGQSSDLGDLDRFFSEKMMPYIRRVQKSFSGSPEFLSKGPGAAAGLRFVIPR